MSEWLVIAAIVIAGLGGVPGLFCSRIGHAGERLATGLATLAALCAGAAATLALVLGSTGELAADWPVPGGRLAIQVDAISAVFVLPIALLSGLGAWYGLEYWPQRAHPQDGRKLRAFYGAVTAGMLLVVVARNTILFLAGWEIMALAAFFLISTEDENPSVCEVGYLYLLTTRAGTLCLFAMFALLYAVSGSLDMASWPVALASPLASTIFVLGLCGFGLKAGVMPLHVWLPGAHATAPSHVSALMSGVLIKTGIYGLVRLTASCEAPPLWWAYALIAAGTVSGVLGVGFAIAQHDFKRMLAYHSVENIGIICIGLGVAVLGRSMGRPELMALGVAGALLHVWNHGLFKALLFASAGSVLHATGTRDIDRLGGLLGRMPRTGLAFLIGAVAICGLPPLNGLVSEFFIYLALFRAGSGGGGPWLAGALAAPALALIGALAVACFVKAFGAIFLGQPRTSDSEHAHEVGPAMLVPMVILATLCLFIGLGAPLVSRVLDVVVLAWAGPDPRMGAETAPGPALTIIAPVIWLSVLSGAVLVAVLLCGRWLARRTRTGANLVGTWDCGYARPTARMQYTASSFADLIVGFLAWALRPHSGRPDLTGLFPAPSDFHSHVPDTVLDRAILPGFALTARGFARLRPIQRGNVRLYIFYILATLLALLFWR